MEQSKNLASKPTLPRYRKCPRQLDDGEPNHHFEDPKTFFQQQYVEAIDFVYGDLKYRFQQERGMPMEAALQNILLMAANGNDDISEECEQHLQLYSMDINIEHLLVQLKILRDLKRVYNENNPSTPIKEITSLHTLCEIFNNLSFSKKFLSEVYKLLRILFTIPVTTATAERTFSVLRHLKTFICSTMGQPRLNHVLLLHVHEEITDTVFLK